MNYIQKIAVFSSIATVINSITFASHAQYCAEFYHTPVTKARLDQLAAAQNIARSQVGRAFQNFALDTIRPGLAIPENNRLFPSNERAAATGGAIQNVVPDGVLPLSVVLFPAPETTYDDSVFYEVKAVTDTTLPPSYSKYQILGFLDALNNSSAANAGEDPAIIFLTNADISSISRDTRAEGFFKGVGVWHAIACEIPTNDTNNLQFGEATLTNPEVYLFPIRIPAPIGPGVPGRLFLR